MSILFRTLMTSVMGLIAPALSYAQNLNGTWNGMLEVNKTTRLAIVINISEDGNGHTQCTMDSPDQGAKGIATEINHLSVDSINISIPRIGAGYRGKLSNDTIRGQFIQMGMPFRLNLSRGNVERVRPQTPAPPYPYTTEEVVFNSGDASLSGTITYPSGYTQYEPVPMVVMVSGSGLQNRDEELYGHKPFLVMADYLARNGIASLRYDDRGVGKSTGRVDDATTMTFMHDAEAALEYVSRQGKMFSRKGVLGHSEGGSIAFMLGARGMADFLVCLAAPSIKGDSIIAWQYNKVSERNGITKRANTHDIKTNAENDTNVWLRFFVNYDPAADISKTRCPVMALNGTRDMQVDAEANLKAIKDDLPANTKNMIKRYDGLNHLFQHCDSGMPDEYGRIEETIAPEVMKDIVEWVKRL